MHKTFPYLKKARVYIIENRVFDEDFNMISRLPDGEVSGIGEDGKSVVILSPYSLDTYYQVPVITYDEMIKEADSILKDRVPDRDICEKYSIE